MTNPRGDTSSWRVVEKEGNRFLDDGQGAVISLKTYDRIVITSAGMVEILYMLKAEDRIAAIGSSFTEIWPGDKTSRLPDVGGLARPSFEKILSFDPELVIANGMNGELALDLQNLGIPTVIHNAATFSDILNSVRIAGELTGTRDRAMEIVTTKSRVLEEITRSLEDKPLNLSGAFLYSAQPMQAFQENSLPGHIFSFLGVRNIADGLATERPILSPEHILEQNPDFLMGAMSIKKPEDILNANRMIPMTRAGREGNIYLLPSEMILRPSPRLIDEMPKLYEMLSRLVKEQ
jgi:iron complex transport system substrate-binding protein